MIKLEDFMNNKSDLLFEAGRGRPKKNPDAGIDPEKQVGKAAEDNATGGRWAIDEPTDDDAKTPIDKESLNKNMKRLLMKLKSKEDFFIMGEAGWGKTSIIKSLAKKQGRSIITVYLDKAEAVDLGGIPVPVQSKNGVHQELAMPAWASYMLEHKDKKFLLFFDEMNQAAPDVQNALMPIVLEHEICGVKFDNFFVGAAGNFESENDAVSELSGPLKSRFKPLIIWESGDWSSVFKYLHKKWDDKLSKAFVNKFEENAELFVNPREVEHKIFKFVQELKNEGDFDYFDPEDYLDRLQGLAKDDLTRAQETSLTLLAEYIYNFMQGKSEEADNGRKKKDINMVGEVMLKQIKQGMKNGYITQEENGKNVKYGISKENIVKVCIECDEEQVLNAEMMERIIRKFEAENIKFKFEKDSEWKEKGYKDPLED